MNTARTRLKLGMVGGGRGAFIGAVHRMAARLDDHYELVAGAFASEPARAIESGIELGIAQDRAYPDYRTMARRESGRADRIDAVSIVTPNDSHFPIAREFLEAGFHVICDKPLTATLPDALELARLVNSTGRVFALAHNYSGYPMVREARERVLSGALGALRVIQVEYPQDWLSTRLEATGQKQAQWRVDPSRAGAAGSLGDLGTHAHHLLRFITGLEVDAVCADLSTAVAGRALEDNAHVLLRLSGGARGVLWSSQVSIGNENALRIRVFGELAGLEWAQEHPNQLKWTELGKAPVVLYRGGAASGASAQRATRLPPGHPEGYIEAFAQIYTDTAELIRVHKEKAPGETPPTLVPGVIDGAIGLGFVDACVRSSNAGGKWTDARIDL
jgi:predicted dehydrogenase